VQIPGLDLAGRLLHRRGPIARSAPEAGVERPLPPARRAGQDRRRPTRRRPALPERPGPAEVDDGPANSRGVARDGDDGPALGDGRGRRRPAGRGGDGLARYTIATRQGPEVLATAGTDDRGRFRLERADALAGRGGMWSPTLWAFQPGSRLAFVEFKRKVPAADEPVRLVLGPPTSAPIRVLRPDGTPAPAWSRWISRPPGRPTGCSTAWRRRPTPTAGRRSTGSRPPTSSPWT